MGCSQRITEQDVAPVMPSLVRDDRETPPDRVVLDQLEAAEFVGEEGLGLQPTLGVGEPIKAEQVPGRCVTLHDESALVPGIGVIVPAQGSAARQLLEVQMGGVKSAIDPEPGKAVRQEPGSRPESVGEPLPNQRIAAIGSHNHIAVVEDVEIGDIRPEL